jgi:ribonucleoside-diphosphate reductase alpha chain
MQSLYDSKCGERGILNRQAVRAKADAIGRDSGHNFLTNPCGEISLRNGQACNLSSVIIRPTDRLEDLLDKIRVATIYGTLQASLTDFRFLRAKWRNHCEEEALLGVSLTGICDHPVMSGKKGEKVLIEWLTAMRKQAREVNKRWAKRLGINPSAAITTIKPEGTSSLLNGSSSGIHPRYSRYVVRTVRQANTDPLTAFLKDQGVPNEPCEMDPFGTTIFSFPMESPKESLTTEEVGTVDQLKLGALYNTYYADHQVSMTVYYNDDSWFPMVDYMWTHWDQMTGVSFLPKFEGNTFTQAPLNAVDKATYQKLLKAQPVIDWSKLAEYEAGDDFTEAGNQSACEGDKCEIS